MSVSPNHLQRAASDEPLHCRPICNCCTPAPALKEALFLQLSCFVLPSPLPYDSTEGGAEKRHTAAEAVLAAQAAAQPSHPADGGGPTLAETANEKKLMKALRDANTNLMGLPGSRMV